MHSSTCGAIGAPEPACAHAMIVATANAIIGVSGCHLHVDQRQVVLDRLNQTFAKDTASHIRRCAEWVLSDEFGRVQARTLIIEKHQRHPSTRPSGQSDAATDSQSDPNSSSIRNG
jgi:hypothetical protein